VLALSAHGDGAGGLSLVDACVVLRGWGRDRVRRLGVRALRSVGLSVAPLLELQEALHRVQGAQRHAEDRAHDGGAAALGGPTARQLHHQPR